MPSYIPVQALFLLACTTMTAALALPEVSLPVWRRAARFLALLRDRKLARKSRELNDRYKKICVIDMRKPRS